MNLNEKLKLARQLEVLGVDIIEAGFAIASPGDFESVAAVASELKNTTVASLARCTLTDIDAAASALKTAKNPRLHVFIATSDIHLAHKLRKTREEVLASVAYHVAYAKNLCSEVEFSAEDASRSDKEFLAQVVSCAISNGARIINIPDTVGYSTPAEMAAIIRYLKENVQNSSLAEFSVHCHNDLGMGVANSLACVAAGVTQIECTINGIGERAGNAALEEVVMAIAIRPELYNATTNINTKQLYRTCRLLSRIIALPINPNKAIVGANAFAHESGIHQHGVLKNPLTYEIMTPESVGIVKNNLVLGKHSGKHAFVGRIAELGYTLTDDDLNQAFEDFKALSDRKREITDMDIEALLDTRTSTKKYFSLNRFVINSGNTIVSTSIIRLQCDDGRIIEDVSTGDGPIDASYKAIDKIVGIESTLLDYSIRAIGKGEDAQGEVAVKVGIGEKTVTGRGLSTDILESSILAYLHAINKLKSLGAF